MNLNFIVLATNLIQIDGKQHEIIGESYIEHDDFMDKLANKYPLLTKRELKLCMYFRLDLSSKEISLIENIADGTIRVYKTKIKSKIGLEKDENLSSFLNNLM